MELRRFDPEQDYVDAVTYWKQQKWPAVPLDLLPQVGIVALDGDRKIAFGWLYQTDSKFALVEFVLGNPNVDWELRDEGVQLVINRLCEEAKERGFTSIFSSIGHKRLIEKYKSNGFRVTDENMTNFIRRLA
jgi:hypothetical protein